MNVIKRLIKRLRKQNPYIEKQLDNADVIVGEKENLTRKERMKRFDDYYKAQDEKHWKAGRKK